MTSDIWIVSIWRRKLIEVVDTSFARSSSSFCWNLVSAEIISNRMKVLQPSADSQKLTYDVPMIVYYLAIPLLFVNLTPP